jgi:hypothetical protein
LSTTQALKRREHHAGVLDDRQEAFAHHHFGGAEGARHHPALPVQVLGARMHHDVGAHRKGTLQHWSGKAVVHGQPGALVTRHGGQRSNVAHIGQRIGRRFGKQQPGVRPHRLAPRRDIGLRHAGRSQPQSERIPSQ